MNSAHSSHSSAAPIDLTQLRVRPLSDRESLTGADEILVQPESPAPECSSSVRKTIALCAQQIIGARKRGAAVMLIYGAHLLRNGAALILERMMARGWISHLATNGAGSIHDWEYAYLGRSTENVRNNVAKGTFGAWDETGRCIHLALMSGGLSGAGYGHALGRFIAEDGVTLPSSETLQTQIASDPTHSATSARADLLVAIREHQLRTGRVDVVHRWKHASIFAQAFHHRVPLTVHPGIGYDIISNHPIFNGAVIGRAATVDFRWFASSVQQLDGGVVLSIGSAIMGPQVFEKTLSCVNNLRLQQGQSIVRDHSIYVVDLQDGANWDWTRGEPPKNHPAYYLRFCKSFSRMGGAMHYSCCDNLAFIHHLYHALCERSTVSGAGLSATSCSAASM